MIHTCPILNAILNNPGEDHRLPSKFHGLLLGMFMGTYAGNVGRYDKS